MYNELLAKIMILEQFLVQHNSKPISIPKNLVSIRYSIIIYFRLLFGYYTSVNWVRNILSLSRLYFFN